MDGDGNKFFFHLEKLSVLVGCRCGRHEQDYVVFNWLVVPGEKEKGVK